MRRISNGQVLILTLIAVSVLIAKPSGTRAAEADKPTPILLGVHDAPVSFHGSDGQVHLAYELWMTNFSSAEASVERVDVLGDGSVLQSMNAAEIARRLQPAGQREAVAVLSKSTEALLFVHVTLPPGAAIPRQISHRIMARVTAAPPGHQEFTEEGGTTTVDRRSVVRIGPPLLGDNYSSPQTLVVMRPVTRERHYQSMDVCGFLNASRSIGSNLIKRGGSVGQENGLESYTIFGKAAIAVADATVESVTNGFNEETPGKYPTDVSLDAADGNSVILDLGDHRYALYAHLQPGSIKVHAKDRVRRGQQLGLVGNTGNSVAPHLHFQVMDGPSSFVSNGLPYEIDEFEITGKTDGTEAFDKAEADGTPLKEFESFSADQSVRGGLPLDQTIVSFKVGHDSPSK